MSLSFTNRNGSTYGVDIGQVMGIIAGVQAAKQAGSAKAAAQAADTSTAGIPAQAAMPAPGEAYATPVVGNAMPAANASYRPIGRPLTGAELSASTSRAAAAAASSRGATMANPEGQAISNPFEAAVASLGVQRAALPAFQENAITQAQRARDFEPTSPLIRMFAPQEISRINDIAKGVAEPSAMRLQGLSEQIQQGRAGLSDLLEAGEGYRRSDAFNRLTGAGKAVGDITAQHGGRIDERNFPAVAQALGDYGQINTPGDVATVMALGERAGAASREEHGRHMLGEALSGKDTSYSTTLKALKDYGAETGDAGLLLSIENSKALQSDRYLGNLLQQQGLERGSAELGERLLGNGIRMYSSLPLEARKDFKLLISPAAERMLGPEGTEHYRNQFKQIQPGLDEASKFDAQARAVKTADDLQKVIDTAGGMIYGIDPTTKKPVPGFGESKQLQAMRGKGRMVPDENGQFVSEADIFQRNVQESIQRLYMQQQGLMGELVGLPSGPGATVSSQLVEGARPIQKSADAAKAAEDIERKRRNAAILKALMNPTSLANIGGLQAPPQEGK